jgi:hypothetical protein
MILILYAILFSPLTSCESDYNNNLPNLYTAYTTNIRENESAFDNATYKYVATGIAGSSLSSEYSKNATVASEKSSHLNTTTSDAMGFLPTPGSWNWDDLGGNAASNVFQIKDNLGRVHNLLKGGDNGLWDNVDGSWQYLGGALASDPCAIKDSAGKIHILAKGSDGALWDRILDGGWVSLGGAIISNPSAALSANGAVKIAVKGSDNSLWLKDLTTGSWTSLGGNIDSNPQLILDAQKNLHVLTKGGDGALWDNVNGIWQNRGGSIASDAMPVINPFDTKYVYVFVRGSDGGLWCNTLDTTMNTATWQNLGGSISTSSIELYKGKPAPVVDPDGVLHTFIRGRDGGLWDSANGIWYGLGGSIKSDPNALRDKNGKVRAATVGIDNGLWINTLGLDQPSTNLVGPIACDYENIQTAVDAASSGSVINVMKGTYKENLAIIKSLIIKGVGSGDTIVDGQKKGTVFFVGNWDKTPIDVTLSDMTLQGGSGISVDVGSSATHLTGGGIFHIFSDLTIDDCVITGNTADDAGGIYTYQGTLNLYDSSIDHNTATYNAGGIFSYSTINLHSSSVSSNIAEKENGGGIMNAGNLAVYSGSIESNNAAQEGGGIWNNYITTYGGITEVFGGSIVSNTADWGAGIFNYGKVDQNAGTISANIAALGGGGVMNFNGIVNDAIYNVNGGSIELNRAIGGAGIENGGTLNINGGIITKNVATQQGGGILTWGTVYLNSGSIEYNEAMPISPSGGGIYDQSHGVFGNKDIVHDNTPDQIADAP